LVSVGRLSLPPPMTSRDVGRGSGVAQGLTYFCTASLIAMSCLGLFLPTPDLVSERLTSTNMRIITQVRTGVNYFLKSFGACRAVHPRWHPATVPAVSHRLDRLPHLPSNCSLG